MPTLTNAKAITTGIPNESVSFKMIYDSSTPNIGFINLQVDTPETSLYLRSNPQSV
jgi:hypothetical protein